MVIATCCYSSLLICYIYYRSPDELVEPNDVNVGGDISSNIDNNDINSNVNNDDINNDINNGNSVDNIDIRKMCTYIICILYGDPMHLHIIYI